MAQLQYPNRPHNAILSVHKKGWSKRVNGKVKVVAGKVPYHEALQKYYVRMANLSASVGAETPAVQVAPVTTANMLSDVPTLIESLSSTMTLRAGSIICTGTPSGVSFARTPPVWMKAGDQISVEIERIGTLKNHVVSALLS